MTTAAKHQRVLSDLAVLEQRHRRQPRRGSSDAFLMGWSGGFEAARTNRLTEDWRPGSLTANAIHRNDAGMLRDRARDLIINNPLAASAVAAYINNVIESGINPKPIHDDRSVRNSRRSAWDHWCCNEADVTGVQHFYEMQQLWLEEIIVGGGCITHFVVLDGARARRRRLAAAIELIPEERIADDNDTYPISRRQNKAGNPISRGVEIDAATGRPVAYWIRPTHPNDTTPFEATEPIRLPASECHYAFFRRRVGQLRGYTLLAPAIMWLWRLGYYLDNELMSSAIKSCFSAMIKTDEDFTGTLAAGNPDGAANDQFGNKLEKIQPGTIMRLKPGEDVTGVGPNSPGSDSTAWLAFIQRSVSVGIGLSYEELVRDYSKGSFSSVRAAMNSDRKRYRPLQQFVVNHFCRPGWAHFATWSAMAGSDGFPSRADFTSDPDEVLSVEWATPGWISVNPIDDAKADEINLRIGATTRERIASRDGGRADENLDQLDREQTRIDSSESLAKWIHKEPAQMQQQQSEEAGQDAA